MANFVAGADLGQVSLTAYVENVFDNNAITYVHPEAFLDARYARLRPRTFGVRLGIDF